MSGAVLENVRKVFESDDEEVIAVEDVSITVGDGEFLVLVGPSGCGKSTTLRLIAGLETITDGEVRIDGELVNDEKPKDRNIAMVFQNYALYPHKTVEQNMRFGLEMTTDLPDDEIGDRVDRAAGMLDIEDLLDRKPNALSGGQKQRVALGRAIVRDPEVFLMDEPLSNLDAKLRTEMRTELQELHEELETATVYVTHDQTEAMTMGDRIAVLNNGRLQQVATPLECYHEPANEFVAGFIGSPSMNFLDLAYDAASGAAKNRNLTYEFDAAHASEIETAGCSEVTLGVRPEDVDIAESSGPHTVTAEVNVVEPMGRENVLHLEIGDAELTALVPGNYHVEHGERVRVRFPEDKVHAFHGRTGDAIFTRERSFDSLPDAARL